MKKLFTLFFLIVFAVCINAQFTTPTVDGSIGAGEYGSHVEGENQLSSDSRTWYVTWDNSNLYVGVTGHTNFSDAIVLYIDIDPQVPVNGGTNANGSQTGTNYDNVDPTFPFRADFFAFVKTDYDDYKTDNGSNDWGASTTATLSKSFNDPSDIGEFAIPWSAITGSGRPSSFNFVGFMSYAGGGGGTFARVPTENPAGTTPNFVRYFTVSSTADGSSTLPFSQNSYCHIGADEGSFGAISVYDYTMNTNGGTITRGTGVWTITNDLVVNDGTVTFGSTASSASVGGDVNIGASGTLTLSSASGGDISVGGDFINSGTFNPSEREVEFNGSAAQSIIGTTTFDYIRINNATNVSLDDNITIDNRIAFEDGQVILGTNNVTMNSGASFDGTDAPGSSKYFVTDDTGVLTRNGVGNTDVLFPVGPSTTAYNPVTINNSGTSDDFSVRAKTTFTNAPNVANSHVDIFWEISEATEGSSASTLTFQWAESQEGASFDRTSDLHIGRYAATQWFGYSATLAESDPYTATNESTISDFDTEFGVGSNGALPVELTSFTGSASENGVVLSWSTATEVNNYGFEVERSEDGTEYTKIGFVEGYGNSNSPKSYTYTDASAAFGKYYYRLKQVDFTGTFEYSGVVEVTASEIEGVVLKQNYPNPFNPTTLIKFGVAEASNAVLTVYNALGQEIAVLFNGMAEPNKVYEFEFNAADKASGIYFYKLSTPNKTEVKKMILSK